MNGKELRRWTEYQFERSFAYINDVTFISLYDDLIAETFPREKNTHQEYSKIRYYVGINSKKEFAWVLQKYSQMEFMVKLPSVSVGNI